MDPHRRRKRKREPHAARPRTAIMSLGDDLIIEILLRLPSPASLARASLTCARWRRLATSRHFLLSFGALHPSPPLLGCFVSCARAAIPAFHRAQICLERDLAAAVRGGDFLLTGMEEREWSLSDCRQGLLLLTSAHKVALFNPLYRRGRLEIRRPIYIYFSSGAADCLLPAACSADDSRVSSFRLVSLENGVQRVRAQVYDSHTGEWRGHPWAPLSMPPAPLQDESRYPSMQAAGRIYWKYARGSVLLSLDTAPGAGGSMELAHVALPPVPAIYKAPASYIVGDTEGGACYLVYVAPSATSARGRALQVWLRNEDTGSWELETEVQEARFLNACGENLPSNNVRQICAVTAGVVLLYLGHGPGRCRYLAFRLKNLHAGLGLHLAPKLPLEADFITCRGLAAKPYLMAWPPSTPPLRCWDASSPAPAIMSLGDDLIIEILLRLPSSASLARASLTCVRWRRLATSRHFLLSFGALHPSPPLLGCFVSCAGAAIPAFHRAQICLERDLAVAVCGGDFLLTGMEEHQWSLSDCRHGLLLLTSTDHKLALFNPIYRRGRLDIRRPLSFSCGRNQSLAADCLLPAACSAEDSRVSSFRLVSLDNGGQRVRAQVYDSRTGKWRCHPWAPPSIRPPAPRRGVQDESPFPSMQAVGRIYWKYERGSVLLSLDTTPGTGGSMELAHVALPPVPAIYQAPASYVVGDTEDGVCCLVCVAPPAASAGGPALHVWLRNEDTDSWELETKVQEARFLNACGEDCSNKVCQICAVTAGVVLLCLDHGPGRCRYLAFRLKNLHAGLGLALTPKSKLPLEADFITCRGLTAKPYLMAWPPSTLLH